MIPPKPFSEDQVKDKFWTPEDWDKNLPSPGFVTDVILALRGIATPAKFQFWSALFAVSAVLKRDAFLEWGPLDFFFNLFIFLIAPPGVCAKTSAVVWLDHHVLSTFHEKIESRFFAVKKKLKILRSKGTAEGLFEFLTPEKSQIVDKGHVIPYMTKSNGALIISELATFLGRQQYNIGLIEKLTDLYDCKRVDDEMTKSRGMRMIEEPYVSLIGGTTADSLSESIPERAFGDGFLSRVILVTQEIPSRVDNEIPKVVHGGPTDEDLQERLAWIAENAQGQFTLSDEAMEKYKGFYQGFMQAIIEDPTLIKKGQSRYTIHVLKVAALLRAQRYEEGRVISVEDFDQARKLVDLTTQESTKTLATVGADPGQKALMALSSYIEKYKEVPRRKLLTTFSGRGLNADIISKALRDLTQQGVIDISLNGCKRTYPTADGKEKYIWVGDDEK